jgi:6-pyruvoyltetrahydropterin/6-carboxytetrahydropterin synthase
MFEISKELTFDSGHRLSKHNGKCFHLHGHTYKAEVTLRGNTLHEVGYLIDFTDVKELLKEITDRLDHKTLLFKDDKLNQEIYNVAPEHCILLDFEPTAENIAKYLYGEMKIKFPFVSQVKVWETPSAYAVYQG